MKDSFRHLLKKYILYKYIRKFRLIVLQNHHQNTINTRCLWQIKIYYDLLNHLGSYGNISYAISDQFQKEKQVKRYLDHQDQSSQKRFQQTVLLITLLAIRQKSRESSFWELMDSFILLAYASLEASKTLSVRLINSLSGYYFRFRRFIQFL